MVQGGLKKVQGGLEPPWHLTSRAYVQVRCSTELMAFRKKAKLFQKQFKPVFGKAPLPLRHRSLFKNGSVNFQVGKTGDQIFAVDVIVLLLI